MLKRLFNPAYRRARAAEGAGDYRAAAALYVEANAPEEAANALLFHAARATTLEERLSAYHDALRWLAPPHPRRAEIEASIGLAILDDAKARGANSAEERRRLAEAARRLESAKRDADAAVAYEILGSDEDAARCLEKAGEVDKLEKLLDRTVQSDERERTLRGLVQDYEMAMTVGARIQARDALERATVTAPDDPAVADMLRRLDDRFPPRGHVEVDVAGDRVALVGKLPIVLGRGGADVVLRGASVSRKHAQIERRGADIVVRDLGSRNGTLVRGLAIAREVALSGATEIGLGDDVTLRIEPLVTASGAGVSLAVVHGLDQGTKVLAGDAGLRVGDLRGVFTFPAGRATLAADTGATMKLGTQACVAPVTLLRGDVIDLDGARVEVIA